MPGGGGESTGGRPPRVFTGRTYQGLTYSAPAPLFDGLAHFGCRLPPAQQPLSSRAHATYRLCGPGSPPALQVLARLPGPASFEVRQETTNRKLRMPSCDRRAPPVTLTKDVLADVGLQEALYTRAAFWALGVSPEVESSAAGSGGLVVVGYALQRLLAMVDHQVLVRYEGTLEENVQTPPQAAGPYTNKAVQTIRQWSCPAGNNYLIECARNLFAHLGALHILESRLVESLASWWDALEAAGYIGPIMEESGRRPLECKRDPVKYHPAFLQGEFHWARFRRQPWMPLAHEQLMRDVLKSTCEGFNINPSPRSQVNLSQSWVQLDNVLLMVVFNLQFYEVIPYIELLYRPFFPHIVYCGPGLPDPLTFPQLSKYNLTFLSYVGTPEGHFPGSFNYECITMVTRMNYDVEGYLVISDDMYLSLTRLTELSLAKPWYLAKTSMRMADLSVLKECRLGTCDFPHSHWRWWEDYRRQTLRSLRYIDAHQGDSALLHRCHKQLVSLTGGTRRAIGAYSDIFFIPQRMAADFSTLLDVFLDKEVFLEIAIASSLWCLERPEDMETIKGLPIWDVDSRDSPYMHFTKKEYLGNTFLHPTKWSSLVSGNYTMRQFYCGRLLPHLHDPYGRMTD